jgi:Trypsin-like peptidase domain
MDMVKVVFVFLILVCAPAFGQNWEMTEKSKVHESVVRVFNDSERTRGSGFVVGKGKECFREGVKGNIGYIMTAGHVVCFDGLPKPHSFNVLFSDGTKVVGVSCHKVNEDWANVESSMRSPTDDVAIIECWVPESIAIIKVASKAPLAGDCVEICGWGADTFRTFSADYGQNCERTDSQFVLTWIVPGDSGGPVLHNGEVIGLVSSGFDRDKKRVIIGSSTSVLTCPLISPSFEKVKKMIDDLPTCSE